MELRGKNKSPSVLHKFKQHLILNHLKQIRSSENKITWYQVIVKAVDISFVKVWWQLHNYTDFKSKQNSQALQWENVSMLMWALVCSQLLMYYLGRLGRLK